MRNFSLVTIALALAACSPPQQQANAPAECARSATHEVTWSSSTAPDVISARSDGPSCVQAVVTLVIRNAAGDPLWTVASSYHDMTVGGVAAQDTPAVSPEQVDAFLAAWANVEPSRSNALPEWRADEATLTESASTFRYDTAFDRETYNALRARDLPMLCYAAAVEATQCLVIDPASNAPTVLAAYGP